MSLSSFIQDGKRWASNHRDNVIQFAEKTYASQEEVDGYVNGHCDGFMCIVPPRPKHDAAAYDKGYRDGMKASG